MATPKIYDLDTYNLVEDLGYDCYKILKTPDYDYAENTGINKYSTIEEDADTNSLSNSAWELRNTAVQTDVGQRSINNVYEDPTEVLEV